MNLSFISVKQQISANLESEGIQATIPVGGVHDVKGDDGVSLTTSNADLIYSLKLKSRHAANQVTWNLKTNYISDTGGQTGSSKVLSSQSLDNTAIGLDGDSVGSSNTHVMALYAQADKDNTGDIIIAGNEDYLPDITFKGGTNDSTVRSALINIQHPTATNVNGDAGVTNPQISIDFTAIGDRVELILLAKKST